MTPFSTKRTAVITSLGAERPQRDSKLGLRANQRRNRSAKRAKTGTCPRSQTTGTDGNRRLPTPVRGQLGVQRAECSCESGLPHTRRLPCDGGRKVVAA